MNFLVETLFLVDVKKRKKIQARIYDFQGAGIQILEKGQANVKRKQNECKSYIGDNFLLSDN